MINWQFPSLDNRTSQEIRWKEIRKEGLPKCAGAYFTRRGPADFPHDIYVTRFKNKKFLYKSIFPITHWLEIPEPDEGE